MSSETIEMYLLNLQRLSSEAAPVRPSQLAQRMGVSAASVAEMLKRLEREGLVRRTEDLGVELTPEGQQRAVALVRRHRLWERFLRDRLRLPLESVHDQACQLEHHTSPEAEERLEEYLDNPRTCPHGHPIPASGGVEEAPSGCPLSALSAGEGGKIVHVGEEDPEMLRYLASLGLLPEVEVEVEELAPFNGPIIVRAGRSRYAIGRTVAEQIHVARRIVA